MATYINVNTSTLLRPPIFALMVQTIEELLGVGAKISPRINEDFALIKMERNELHFIERGIRTIDICIKEV